MLSQLLLTTDEICSVIVMLQKKTHIRYEIIIIKRFNTDTLCYMKQFYMQFINRWFIFQFLL